MKMSPRERLMARLAGETVDRIPNLNIVMLFAAQFAGQRYGDFCRDYHVLVEGQLKTAEEFGIDILSTMSDPFRETNDYGVKISYAEDDLPRKMENLIEDSDEIAEKIHRWDPMSSVRMLDRIRAVESFKKLRGDEFPILGWVEGPWAEFADLADISDAMVMLIDDPDAVEQGMDVITQQAIACAEAQIEAGADVIGMGDAASSLISADMYREDVFPREKQIVEAIHRAGGKVKLHICGNVDHIIADMIDTGSDIVDIDYMVDADRAISLAHGRCSISGNINPTAVIFQGTEEDNREAVRWFVDHGDNRSIVSSGCEIPKMTPVGNVYAIADEIRKLSCS